MGAFSSIDGLRPEELFAGLKTPCYVIDETVLRQNGKCLSALAKKTGCKILLAQKAFSNYDFYPLLSEFLDGTEASGLYEARLGHEEMPGKEVHVFCAAYREDEFNELMDYADHIVFNSVHQLQKFGAVAKSCGKSTGLRINPECSTQSGHGIYDPCAPGSRLGVTRKCWDEEMTPELLALLDGLHFHTLCEQNSDALAITLRAVEERFGDVLPLMKWLNMGGGHHITRDNYNLTALEQIIEYVQEKWHLEVYLEPGEAVALNSGFLVTRVLDIVRNDSTHIAILDASAACHMPDVLEMPYMPPVYRATESSSDNEFTFRLAGPTCLAGDVIGDYCFSDNLHTGDMVLFGDMAIYTTCKNNTFNGMPLPNIWMMTSKRSLSPLTNFGYETFKSRLGR